MISSLLNILFPEKCPVCQMPAKNHAIAPICSDCWKAVIPYEGPACRRCGKPLVSEIATICGDCIQNEPPFVYSRSFGLYNGVLRKAINLLKYHNIKRLSRPLSDILLSISIPEADAVIPVPLHKNRLRQREFNQSALLAGHIGEKTGISVILNCLVKVEDTMPQVGLSSHARRKNIRRAFQVKNIKQIEGKNIVLMDDVVTTGATVRECSRVLKEAGAENIYVITLAHGIPD